MIDSIIKQPDLLPKLLVSVRAPLEVLGKRELKDNISVVDWHMPVSTAPNKYAISLKSNDTTSRMIKGAGNFVINFMGAEHQSVVLSCENRDGMFLDLFETLGVTKVEADMVESPRIKEAKAVLECEVEHELESGDHTIFIGKVVGPRI